MRKPWGIECPAQLDARFHFMAEGTAWLRGAAFGRIRLRAGDVALLPRGIRHVLADSPRSRAKLLSTYPFEATGDTTYRLTAGGRGARTLVVCCSVGFGAPAVHPLLELMPPVLVVRGGARKDSALPTLLEIMAAEVAAPRIGTATIMARLADVIIARVLRAWVDSRRGDTVGWLAAVRDPRIGRALAAVHRAPGRQWSVDALPEVAGTSRTLFAERFAALVGVPPARYLGRWRMHLASTWLRKDQLSVSEAAERLGDESEASFSRAFKRIVGVPSSTLRRRGIW